MKIDNQLLSTVKNEVREALSVIAAVQQVELLCSAR